MSYTREEMQAIIARAERIDADLRDTLSQEDVAAIASDLGISQTALERARAERELIAYDSTVQQIQAPGVMKPRSDGKGRHRDSGSGTEEYILVFALVLGFCVALATVMVWWALAV